MDNFSHKTIWTRQKLWLYQYCVTPYRANSNKERYKQTVNLINWKSYNKYVNG